MKESEKPVTREMWYQGQKHHVDLIKHLEQKIVQLIELVEELINGRK